MGRKASSNRVMKFAQSCCSRECVKNHSDEFDKEIGSCPPTPHELDKDKKTVTCLYCGKITKLK